MPLNPYKFTAPLLASLRQAFLSATVVPEAIELSNPDRRDYFVITFSQPVLAPVTENGVRLIELLFKGDKALTRQINLSLLTYQITVESGFRWFGSCSEPPEIELHGLAIKIIYPGSKIFSRRIASSFICQQLAEASLVVEWRRLRELFENLPIPEPVQDRPASYPAAGFFKPKTSPLLLNYAQAWIRTHITRVFPAYTRTNESAINPVYQDICNVSHPLQKNEKKIWLLRSDFILSVGNKNGFWTTFNDHGLSDTIDKSLHRYVNWEDRYGHPSLAVRHHGYDGSAYYGGYLAQREDCLEIYLFSGRYDRSDLEDDEQAMLEVYIACRLRTAYGEQPVVFIDAAMYDDKPDSLDHFALSLFLRDKPLPEQCARRIYEADTIQAVLNRQLFSSCRRMP